MIIWGVSCVMIGVSDGNWFKVVVDMIICFYICGEFVWDFFFGYFSFGG